MDKAKGISRKLLKHARLKNIAVTVYHGEHRGPYGFCALADKNHRTVDIYRFDMRTLEENCFLLAHELGHHEDWDKNGCSVTFQVASRRYNSKDEDITPEQAAEVADTEWRAWNYGRVMLTRAGAELDTMVRFATFRDECMLNYEEGISDAERKFKRNVPREGIPREEGITTACRGLGNKAVRLLRRVLW